jgi:O-antigen ligase
MTLLLFLLGIASLACFIQVIVWFGSISWLKNLTRILILSLPFERIPSISISGSNLRISQVIIILLTIISATLFLKKDPEMMKIHVSRINIFWLGFLLTSVISFFGIQDFKRFVITEFATVMVFLAFFFVSTFAGNVFERIKELVVVMIGVTIFGFYQLLGDLAGLPIMFTGLREQYTKLVFGIARIHATAIEPLYFAGMLFLPLFASMVFLLIQQPTLLKKFALLQKIPLMVRQILLILLFLIGFFLTISKSAIGIFIILIPIFLIVCTISFGNVIVQNIRHLAPYIIWIIGIIGFATVFIPSVNNVLVNISENVVDTVNGTSASSEERSGFIKTAQILLEKNQLLGIGSGQYGVEAKYFIPQLENDDSFLIVNNVYLEVWLEHGLIPMVVFITWLLTVIGLGFKNLFQYKNLDINSKSSLLILTFSLTAYSLQWLTFSPIFIMPIFILLGLLTHLIESISQSNAKI